MIKLSQYAKRNNLGYLTAYRHYNLGFLKGKQLPSGTILVYEDSELINNSDNKQTNVVLYARVSSSENKPNLISQMDRLRSYATAKGYNILSEVSEVGSGVNDKRPKLEAILKTNSGWNKIIVEHKDRLARFGVNYITILLNNIGKDIEIINQAQTDKEDIMQDFISIITSFCSKIYGLRRTKRKTEEIIKSLTQDTNI